MVAVRRRRKQPSRNNGRGQVASNSPPWNRRLTRSTSTEQNTGTTSQTMRTWALLYCPSSKRRLMEGTSSGTSSTNLITLLFCLFRKSDLLCPTVIVWSRDQRLTSTHFTEYYCVTLFRQHESKYYIQLYPLFRFKSNINTEIEWTIDSLSILTT